MVKHIFKCVSCNTYTLHEQCPACSGKAIRPLPPKFSLDDKYGKYRREAKKEEFQMKGLY